MRLFKQAVNKNLIRDPQPNAFLAGPTVAFGTLSTVLSGYHSVAVSFYLLPELIRFFSFFAKKISIFDVQECQ